MTLIHGLPNPFQILLIQKSSPIRLIDSYFVTLSFLAHL